MRIAMGVEYDGRDFHGWQLQPGVRTVQDCLEGAVARVADHPIRLHCAGRTDTGVHALGQVVHFDTQARRRSRSWVLGCNVNLPDDLSVTWAREVDEAFHARFSAVARHYHYQILNRATRPALARRQVTWVHDHLDLEPMRQAAVHLVGTHDFSSYRALGCQAKSPVRTLHYLQLARDGQRISIRVGANGFLHHMVRNIAGVLIAIGRGDHPPGWAKEVLEYRDRTQGGITAPPDGLALTQVDYPPEWQLPTAGPDLGWID